MSERNIVKPGKHGDINDLTSKRKIIFRTACRHDGTVKVLMRDQNIAFIHIQFCLTEGICHGFREGFAFRFPFCLITIDDRRRNVRKAPNMKRTVFVQHVNAFHLSGPGAAYMNVHLFKECRTIIDQVSPVMVSGNHKDIDVFILQCAEKLIQNFHRIRFRHLRIINIAGKNNGIDLSLYCFFYDLLKNTALIFNHRVAVHLPAKVQVCQMCKSHVLIITRIEANYHQRCANDNVS